jgi:hypothetical protein
MWHRETAAQAHLAACTVSDDFPETREIASSKTPRNDRALSPETH